MKVSATVCGAGLGFLAFGISLLIGLWVDNPFITLVTRALKLLVIFFFIGSILGHLGLKVIHENYEQLRAEDELEAEEIENLPQVAQVGEIPPDQQPQKQPVQNQQTPQPEPAAL